MEDYILLYEDILKVIDMNYINSMTTKEKIEYIWDYYKFHIIIGLAIILFAASIVYSQLTRPIYVFNITYMGSSVDDNKINEFEKELTKVIFKSTDKRHTALVEALPINNSNEASIGVNPQLIQKFFAEEAAGDIDVVIMDKSNFDTFSSSGAFVPLNNINGMDLTRLKSDKADKGFYTINVQDNKVLKEAGFDTKNKVLSIMLSSKRKDKAIEVVKWILSK